MFEIKGSMKPTVVNTISGTYAVSGSNWKSVPEGTTLKDLKWINTNPKIKKSKPKNWKVKDYTISFNGTLSIAAYRIHSSVDLLDSFSFSRS